MKKVVVTAATVAMLGMSTSASAVMMEFFGENLTPGETVSGDPVTARASFDAFLSGVSTEDFESFATGGIGAGLALSFTGSAGTIDGTLTGAGTINNSPFVGLFATSGDQYYDNDFSSFTVSFTSPIAAFGFYATDVGDVSGQLSITLDGTRTFDIPHTIDGPSGSLLFYGIIDTDTPFSTITFTGSASDDRFGFDDLTVGDVEQVVPVPEPGAMGLMLLGIGVLGWAARRRRA